MVTISLIPHWYTFILHEYPMHHVNWCSMHNSYSSEPSLRLVQAHTIQLQLAITLANLFSVSIISIYIHSQTPPPQWWEPRIYVGRQGSNPMPKLDNGEHSKLGEGPIYFLQANLCWHMRGQFHKKKIIKNFLKKSATLDRLEPI